MERAGLEGGDGESTYDQNTEHEILKDSAGHCGREIASEYSARQILFSIKEKKIKELTKHYITLIK